MSQIPGDGRHGPRNTLPLALALTAGFAAVEFVSGWLAGSLALMGDAGHMISDASALGLATFAGWLARRPADSRHSFGLERAEVLAALTNGLFMLVIVGGILVGAVQRLQSPAQVNSVAVMVVGGLGLVINAAVLVTLSHGERNLNVRGAILHVLGDLLGSVAAVLAGVVIFFTGWMPIDPILSLVICVLILYSSIQLLRETIHVIMEGVPGHIDLNEVGYALAGLDDVDSVHDLHIWSLSSGTVALSAHIVIEHMDIWDTVLQNIHRLLDERFGIHHATLQPEPKTRRLQHLPGVGPAGSSSRATKGSTS